MVRQRLNKLIIYRYRYVAAYVAFAAALATMLIVSGFYLPGGLTSGEMHSAIISDNLAPSQLFHLQPDELIYLPYRLSQAGSIALFGVSVIGIKLPSIILGFVSALGLLYLLNLWYRPNVAIISAMIAVTTNQFLIAAQAGQAGIMYIFLTILILIAASMVARRNVYAKLWVIAGFILAAISLYLPLSIYVLIALALTALIHPHARHVIIRRSAKGTIAIGLILFAAIISPIVIGCIHDITVLWRLLGLDLGNTNLGDNALELLRSYGNFTKPVSGTLITPVYGLGLVVLLALGVYRLVSRKYTTKSYILSFWLVMLIPLVIINPEFISITFVPVLLLIALAVEYLIASWYKLFPNNPYARIFGLFPLGIVLGGLIISSIDRYVYGLHYDTNVYSAYSYDVTLLNSKLQTMKSSDRVMLVVSQTDAPFYQSYARHQTAIKDLSVTTQNDPNFIGTKIYDRVNKRQESKIPSEIVVTRTMRDADRFYLYKN